jgi:hypothetical protein
MAADGSGWQIIETARSGADRAARAIGSECARSIHRAELVPPGVPLVVAAVNDGDHWRRAASAPRTRPRSKKAPAQRALALSLATYNMRTFLGFGKARTSAVIRTHDGCVEFSRAYIQNRKKIPVTL